MPCIGRGKEGGGTRRLCIAPPAGLVKSTWRKACTASASNTWATGNPTASKWAGADRASDDPAFRYFAISQANGRFRSWGGQLPPGHAGRVHCHPLFAQVPLHPGRRGRTRPIRNRKPPLLFPLFSMPDKRLFQLASQGKLRKKAVLRKEVERMLLDPKAAAFEHNFTVTWLRLNKLGKMPPERVGLSGFTMTAGWSRCSSGNRWLTSPKSSKNNGQIRNFIEFGLHLHEPSDRPMDVQAQRHQRRFPATGQAPVIPSAGAACLPSPASATATANGVDTTPIVRGVWVLENILGTPPAPPPPDVEPLAHLRGAKTIREQLELHRKSEACNGCHRKIDPMELPIRKFRPRRPLARTVSHQAPPRN